MSNGDDRDPRAFAAWRYAFEKCGFLVTGTNRHLFTDDQLAEWEAAIDEWEAEN